MRYTRSYRNRTHSDFDLWIPIIILGIFFVSWLIDLIYQKYRRGKIADYCKRNRLDYSDDPVMAPYSASLFLKGSGYDLTQKGDYDRGFRAVMHGMMGEMEFRSADFYYTNYSYSSRGRRNKTTYRYTVTELHKKNAMLSYFFAREEHFYDGIGEVLGNQDIDFTADKEFSDKFILQGCESDVRQIFNQRVRTAFLQNHNGGYAYEGNNDCLLIYTKGWKGIDARLKMLEKGYNIMKALAPDNPQARFIPDAPPLDPNQSAESYNSDGGGYSTGYGTGYDQQYGQKPKTNKSWKDACDPLNDFRG